MKNIFFKIFVLLVFVVSSCEKEDKYEGTPAFNKLDIETIKGSIVSNTPFALPGQSIDFTATLPLDFVNKVNQDIDIEVLTSTIGGSNRRTSIKLLKGQNVVSGKVLVGGGGGTFFMPVKLKLNAVNLPTTLAGKHYLLTSDEVTIDSGITSVPVDDDKRLQIKVDWESLTTGNSLTCTINRIGSTSITLRGSAVTNARVTISGTNYPFTYNTDLKTTAENFVSTYGTVINTDKNIIVTSFGKSIFFKYATPTPPAISIASTSTPIGTATNLNGRVFNSFNFQPGSSASGSKEFPILNSQIPNVLAGGQESEVGAFNEGDYEITIKPAILETTPKDLKYRIIFKKPNGEVLISNGVFVGATTTSSPKKIATFSKVGYGDASDYNNFIFYP